MAELSLTILGASLAWVNPGGANSGYLLTSGSDRLLVECGSGVISRLRTVTTIDELSAILISHMHADHFIDLVQLRYGIKYGGWRQQELPLYVPPGGTAFLARLGSALDDEPAFFSDCYRLAEYDPEAPVRVGRFSVTFRQVQHYVPSFAMRVNSGRVLVFSGDAGPCDALVEHARDADVLLCEAAIRTTDHDDPRPDRRGHMTPGEAGQVAARAGVKRLVLTHYRWGNGEEREVADEARAHFDGPIEVAREGQTYTI